MRSRASLANAKRGTWSCDPAAVLRDPVRRAGRPVRRPRARRRAAGAPLLGLRVRARHALHGLPGARRRAVRARRVGHRLPARPRRCDRARRGAQEAAGRMGLRPALFAFGAVGLGFMLVWGVAALPPFGHYAGPYGDIVSKLAEPQRHMANAVTATVFDYRGFDTMGEELILFCAASAVARLLRSSRGHATEGIVGAVRSDAINGAGVLAAITVLLLGLYVVAHGFVSPGGGFQGGVVLAAAFVLVFLAVEYHAYHRLASPRFAEPLESFGAGSYLGLGLLAFAFGLAFLENFIDFGVTGRLRSGGSAALVNWASALAVCGGFLLIFSEYLEENMAARHRKDTA